MQKLENHIENLLRKHDFVLVPAFGGFVASEKSAQMENGYLLPPTRTVGFNPDLNYNDGLLAQEVAKAEGISLVEANNFIAEKVEKLNTTLKTFKHLSFANIGTFHLNGEKVCFEPHKTNDLLIDSFGLQSFYFPEIVTNTISLAEKVRAEKEERQTKATRGFNYAVACVAAILLLLLIPINFNQKQVVYRATFVPIQALEEVVVTPEVEEEIICTPYHAVIGSFNSQAKAIKFLSELPKELSNSKIVYSDNRFRIITDSYETEEIGEIEIEKFAKKYPQFKDVWLLEYNP
jgi:nucleoid DNA-binding protein